MSEENTDPKAVQALYAVIAAGLEQSGKINEALKYYQQAIDIDPTNGILRYNVGLLCMKYSRIEESIRELKESIKYNPDYADSYFALATCYSEKRNSVVAALYYLAYLDLNQTGEKVVNAKARLFELGPEAIKFPIQKFMDVVTKDFEVRFEGLQKVIRDKIDNKVSPDVVAKTMGAASKAFGQEFAHPHLLIAGDFYEKHKLRAAIVHLICALEIRPSIQWAIGLLAACYAELGEYSQAEEVLRLIEFDKAEPNEIQMLKDQYIHLKEYIQSEKAK